MCYRSSRLSCLIVAFLALALIPGCNSNRDNTNTVQIGVFLPLTGQMQPYGINAREGLTLALEEVNKRGGIKGRKVELIVLDDKGEQVETLNVVKQLIDRKGVKILIGGLTSSGTLDAAAYAKERKVLLFSPAASHPDIPSVGHPFFIRNWQSDAIAAEAAAAFAWHDLKARKAAIVYVNNAYGQGQRKAFEKKFAEFGGTIEVDRGFNQEETGTIRNLLSAVKSAGPDIVFAPAYPRDYEEILTQAANLQLELPLIATDTFQDPALMESVKDRANQLYFLVAEGPEENYAPGAAFREKYKSRFNSANGEPKDPGLVSDTAYDALHLIAEEAERVGLDPETLTAAIRARKGYEGAAGVTTFTELGDVVRPVAVKKLEGGRPVVHKRM